MPHVLPPVYFYHAIATLISSASQASSLNSSAGYTPIQPACIRVIPQQFIQSLFAWVLLMFPHYYDYFCSNPSHASAFAWLSIDNKQGSSSL